MMGYLDNQYKARIRKQREQWEFNRGVRWWNKKLNYWYAFCVAFIAWVIVNFFEIMHLL